MDLDGRLTLLLRDCAWATEASVALRLVPELAQDCPPVHEVPLGDGTTSLGMAWGGDSDIVPATAEIVDRLVQKAIKGQAREDFSSPTRAELVRDPLVGPLCRLIAQTDVPAFQIQALPMLGLARAVSLCLRGDAAAMGAQAVRPDVSKRLADHAIEIARMPAARRAEIMAEVAIGVAGRASASFAEVYGGRGRVGGLSRRIMADPLALCLGRGTLDRDPDLVFVAMVAALPISSIALQHIRAVAALALESLHDRRNKGKLHVVDEMVVQSARELRSLPTTADRLLFHPTAGPLLVGALPELLDAKALERDGVPRDVAKIFTRIEGVQGLAASWADLVEALLVWDVISTLADKLVPFHHVNGQWRGPAGPLPSQPRWNLIVPRSGGAPTDSAVVAVRLNEVVEHLRKLDVLDSPAHVVERAWAHATRGASGVLSCVQAETGIAVFADAVDALSFASSFLSDLAVSGLDRGDGERVQLPDHVHGSAGIAWGAVTGGTDGRAVHLGGAAVARAFTLAGAESPDTLSARDPIGISRVVVGAKGLLSRGVVSDGWIVKKALEVVKQRHLPLHLHGSKMNVAGAANDFQQVPISAWWQDGDWVSCFYPLDASDPGGTSEHLQLSRAQFRRIYSDDQQIPDAEEPESPRPAHPMVTEGSSASVSFVAKKRPPPRGEDVEDMSSEPPESMLVVPHVSFNLDVPEAAVDASSGYAADLWGPEEDTLDAPSVEQKSPRPHEEVADPDSLGDVVSYDGPVVSIEETDDPRSQDELRLDDMESQDLEPIGIEPTGPAGVHAERSPPPPRRQTQGAEWDEEVPTDGSGKPVPDPLPDPEAWPGEPFQEPGFGGSTMTVRPLDRRDVLPADPWDDIRTDPNIRLYSLDSADEESEPTDERRPVRQPRAADYGGGRLAEQVPDAPPLKDPAMPDGARATTRTAMEDLGPMLVGYVCLQIDAGGEAGFTFGRIYGNRLVDVHSYATRDQNEAYGRFLKDKIVEGFVPRMELTTFLPEDAEVRAVDLRLLNSTYQAMVSP